MRGLISIFDERRNRKTTIEVQEKPETDESFINIKLLGI